MEFWLVNFLTLLGFQRLLNKLSGDKSLGWGWTWFISAVVSPLLMAASLYLSYWILPGRQTYVYPVATILPALIIWVVNTVTGSPKVKSKREISSTKLSLEGWYLLLISIFITCFSLIRMVFWPPIWFDQLLYLKQGNAFYLSTQLTDFERTQTFTLGEFSHEFLAEIRPGLPLIYSSYLTLTRGSLEVSESGLQMILGYYFVLLTVGVWLFTLSLTRNKNATAFSTFLTLTSFYLVNFSIWGFKELLIVDLLLVALWTLIKGNENRFNPAFLGFLLGLMSFVNYSGTIIGFLVLVISAVAANGTLLNRFSTITRVFVWWWAISLTEHLILLKWVFQSVLRKDDVIIPVATQAPTLLQNASTTAVGELGAYQIISNIDLYLRGKLQGLVQVQYYGPILFLFILMIAFNIKGVLKQGWARYLLLFITIYGLVFFDPLSLNTHRFSYILAVSPKYTVIVIPLVAVLLASQYDWIRKILDKLGLWILLPLIIICVGLGTVLWLKPESFINAISELVPLINPQSYYLVKLRQLGVLLMSGTLASSLILVPLLWRQKNRLSRYIFLELVTLVILLPFVFSFNNNVGWANTIKYLFADRQTKLENVIADEDYYKAMGYLNSIQGASKLYLVGQNYYPVSYFWHGSDKDIFDVRDYYLQTVNRLPSLDLSRWLLENRVNLIFSRGEIVEGSGITSERLGIEKMYQAGENIVYKVVQNRLKK